MTTIDRPIRFMSTTQYGESGTINSTYDFGVRDALVGRGVAEWVEERQEPVRKSRKSETSEKGI